MKVLVTGATGFLGRALVSRLLEDRRHQVTAAVRGEKRTIEGAEIVQVGDMCGSTNWRAAVSGVHAVIHTAGRAHVTRDTSSDPDAELRKVNVQGTIALAEQAAAAGVRRFVFISSVKANGECTEIGRPYTEDQSPAPEDPYGMSKLEGELGLREVAARTGMELVIVRPPLVYGPEVKGNFLRLLRLIASGTPLPFRHIENRRSLIGIDNLVDFIVRCTEHSAAAGELFFVSDGKDLSTAELVQRLAASMGRRAYLFPVPLAFGRAVLKAAGQEKVWIRLFGSLQVSCEKAKRLLSWKPPVGVDEGIERVGRWYVEQQRA